MMIGFGDFVLLYLLFNCDVDGYMWYVVMFIVLSIMYFIIGLVIVFSVLLLIRNVMEDRLLVGF